MGWDKFMTFQQAKDAAVDEHIQVTAALQLKCTRVTVETND